MTGRRHGDGRLSGLLARDGPSLAIIENDHDAANVQDAPTLPTSFDTVAVVGDVISTAALSVWTSIIG
jgi:hypothetical protein